jgi:1-acyl-sn-glycerol-3-phosphate acyltransferase
LHARAASRIALVALVMGGGFVAALFFPLLSASTRAALCGTWSHAMLAALGVRVARTGRAGAGGLIIANHVSWLDVVVISATWPDARFICKQEIGAWPLIGWLLRRAGTFFIRRGSAFSAWRAVLRMTPALAARSNIAVFPEGTTSAGDSVLPFHAAFFQAAVNAGCAVQPVALAYGDRHGLRRYEAVYAGETSFGESLLRIARASDLVVTVALLPAFPAAGLTRRQAAARAREMITSRIGHLDVAPASQAEPILRAA